MNGVGAAPEVVGRERQHADHAADPVVGEPVAEEGAVAAVVLDHERPHQEAGGRHRQQQRQPPIAEIIGGPGQRPQRRERREGDRDLDDAAGVAWLAIAREDLRPAPRGRCDGRTSGIRFVLQEFNSVVLEEVGSFLATGLWDATADASHWPDRRDVRTRFSAMTPSTACVRCVSFRALGDLPQIGGFSQIGRLSTGGSGLVCAGSRSRTSRNIHRLPGHRSKCLQAILLSPQLCGQTLVNFRGILAAGNDDLSLSGNLLTRLSLFHPKGRISSVAPAAAGGPSWRLPCISSHASHVWRWRLRCRRSAAGRAAAKQDAGARRDRHQSDLRHPAAGRTVRDVARRERRQRRGGDRGRQRRRTRRRMRASSPPPPIGAPALPGRSRTAKRRSTSRGSW